MTNVKGANEAVQAQFSRHAKKYETSQVHARGEDLQWIVQIASLTGTERVLDVGTGTGHTAMALADNARTVMGIDLTARMLESATTLAANRNLANVQFVVSDVVQMPFPSSYFDVATCRFAAHHFAHADAAVAEIARVLKPGGRVILADHIAPEQSNLDAFINRLDWLRDNSHVREWRVSEWVEKFRTVGISAGAVRYWDLTLDFAWWIQQATPSEEMRTAIVDMLQRASDEMRETFHIHLDSEYHPTSFALKCAIIEGTKLESTKNKDTNVD